MTMPRPATAAAMAPSLPAIRARPWMRIELVVQSFSNAQVGFVLPGPTIMEWEERSAGVRGTPALLRYRGEAAITRGQDPIGRAVAVESVRGPYRKATLKP